MKRPQCRTNGPKVREWFWIICVPIRIEFPNYADKECKIHRHYDLVSKSNSGHPNVNPQVAHVSHKVAYISRQVNFQMVHMNHAALLNV